MVNTPFALVHFLQHMGALAMQAASRALHVKEEVQKEKGRIDITKALPLVFCPGANEYWSLGKCIGHYGFTKGKP